MGLINDLIRTVLGQSLGLGFDLLGQSLQQRQLNKQGVQTGQAVQSLLQPQPDIAGAAALGRTPAAFTPFGDQPPSPLTDISDKLPQFPADQLGLILQDPQAMELIMNQLTQQQLPGQEAIKLTAGGVGKLTEGGFQPLDVQRAEDILRGNLTVPQSEIAQTIADLEGRKTQAKEDILQPNRLATIAARKSGGGAGRRTGASARVGTGGALQNVTGTDINTLEKQIARFAPDLYDKDPSTGKILGIKAGQEELVGLYLERANEIVSTQKKKNPLLAAKQAVNQVDTQITQPLETEIERRIQSLSEGQKKRANALFKRARGNRPALERTLNTIESMGGTSEEEVSPLPPLDTPVDAVQARINELIKAGRPVNKIREDLEKKGIDPNQYTYGQ